MILKQPNLTKLLKPTTDESTEGKTPLLERLTHKRTNKNVTGNFSTFDRHKYDSSNSDDTRK
eukprot:m.248841 g.248841  ORF g.248841 m.248841 type:complete len:62 (+) comp26674_c0_seq11:144-329(+)